jgi:formylglycine-generating enzyme required for sulfatase activity
MAGNVWEWVADKYDSSYYSNSPASNPQGPSTRDARVLRGGGFDTDPQLVRAANRDWSSPFYRNTTYGDYGFRIAASPI